MISSGRTRSKRYSGSLSPKLVVLFVALFCLCLTVVVKSRHASPLQVTSRISPSQFLPAADAPATRTIFPLSVIHGGAYSQTELARARKTDAVVAAHYAGFGSTPRFQKLPHDMLMYVSYRRSNQVYWSQTRHRIPQGETVISDGNCLARARCGNRLSATPQGPVAPKEPTEEVLNTPDLPDTPVSYKLADLPGPAGRPFAFLFPTTFDGAAPAAASPAGFAAPGGSPFIAPAAPFGTGPFAVGGGPRPSAGAAPPVVPPSASLLLPATSGGSTLPTSTNFPGSGPVPILVPNSPVGELVPEPGVLGYLAVFCLFAGFTLLRRLGSGFLRGEVG